MANSSASTCAAVLLLIVTAMAAPQPAYSSLPFGGNDIFGCLRAISSVEGCATRVVVPAPLTARLLLTQECCEAVEKIVEKCFTNIYPPIMSLYVPDLGSLLRGICGGASSPAPEPAAA